MILADPPVRADGLCAQCGGPRKYAVPNRYSGNDAVEDPFCSAGCARDWHDNPLPIAANIGLRGASA